MAMVCYCGESAFGSAEGGLSTNTVFNFKPLAVLGTARHVIILRLPCSQFD